jgi:REP element-mobilizing transposase RayT
MTVPRRILPGVTYMITRRCAGGQFLLRPSPQVNRILLYLLAVAAERYGILVHAFCALSNHWHLIVTDPGARLPAFEQFLHGLTARVLNAAHGRWENLWAPSSYSAVTLTTPASVVEKSGYVLANPALSDLVRSSRDWPGIWSAPEQVGGAPIRVRRPEGFFSPNGSMPEVAELTVVPPPGFTAEEFRTKVVAELTAVERRAADERRASGRGVIGRDAALEQPATATPAGRKPHRNLNPRFAGRDPSKLAEALSRMKEFLRTYREALKKRRAGEPQLFPAGTYHLRVFHAVPCSSGP